MKLTKALKVSGLAALLGTAMMGAAHAGTSGTEFQDAYDLILGWLGGYLGRAIALCFFVIGIFMGVARQNLMAGGIAVAAAFSIAIMPGILDGVLTGTVTDETVAVAADTTDGAALIAATK